MPGNDTHAAAGGAGAGLVCLLVDLPIAWWPIPVLIAGVASPWPDRLEKIPRALWRLVRDRKPRRRALLSLQDGLDRRLRKLQVHRRWTHWLSVAVLLALAAGLAAGGALVGVAALVLIGVEAAAHSDAAMPGEVWTFAPWIAAFTALGVLVGCALHSYLDGYTELGSPMLGVPGCPRTQRRVHVPAVRFTWRGVRLVPRTAGHWLDKKDEARIRAVAPLVIVACVALHFYADLAPLVAPLVEDAYRALVRLVA